MGEPSTQLVLARAVGGIFEPIVMNRRPLLLAVALLGALSACRDRAEGVVGGAWVGEPVDQRTDELDEEGLDEVAPAVAAAPEPSEAVAEPDEVEAPDASAAPALAAAPSGDLAAPAGDAPAEGDRMAAAQRFFDQRRYGDALAEALLAEHDDESNHAIPLFLARVYQRLRRHGDAADAFGRALALAPDNVEALYGRAVALVELSRFTDAIAVLERLQKLQPQSADVAQLLAVARSRTGQTEAAMADLRRAAEGGSRGAQERLGNALGASGDFGNAAEALARVAVERPDDADLQLRLGTALGLAGKQAEAESALVKATQLAPDNDTAWRNLAALREQRGDAEGAAKAWEALLPRLDGVEKLRLQQRIDGLRAGGLKQSP